MVTRKEYVTQKMDTEISEYGGFKPGDRVRLHSEDYPDELGTILTIDRYSWGVHFLVQVVAEDIDDDGLRECGIENMEHVEA